MVLDYFRKKFAKPSDQTFIFDGFPYDLNQAKIFIGSVGLPSFVIYMKLPKEALIARFRSKNEIEAETELQDD